MEKKPSILIIYTGGTIGMVQRESSGVLVPVKFDQIQEEVPDLNRLEVNLQVVTIVLTGSASDRNTSHRWQRKPDYIHTDCCRQAKRTAYRS